MMDPERYGDDLLREADGKWVKWEDMEVALGLLRRVAAGLGPVWYPNPEARTREWVSELGTYLRGDAGAHLFLDPKDMELLEAQKE